MYDDLVKSLRQCADASCAGCKNDLVEIGCRGLLQREAADVIEELQRTQMSSAKWISVEERLPEDGTRCLATRFDYVTKTPFLDLLWFEGGEWCNRRFRGDFAVTHWMPLPDHPGGER